MSHGGGEPEYSKYSVFETKDTIDLAEDLSRDKFLGVLSPGGSTNLAGLVNFDFRILRRQMKNISVK